MKHKLERLVVLGLMVVLLFACSPGSVRGQGHLTVLMYHRFDAGTSISIPMDQFRRQIQYLQSHDYHFVTPEELGEHLRSRRPFPERSVLITVDDGYRSTYTHAYPFLKKQGIPWILYIYTEAVDRGYSSALSWPMLREMANHGVVIGNHSYSHGKFIHVRDKTSGWIEKELVEPRRRLREQTGQAVRTFAIPYGMYDASLVSILRDQLGYSVVFSSDPGVVDPRDPGPVLNRFGINGSTSWDQFLKKLNRLPLSVQSVRPQPGRRLGRTPDQVRVDFRNPRRLTEGQVNVFLSEFGRLNHRWVDREEGVLVAEIPAPLTRSWNRIIVTALDRSTNRYRYYSQGLVFTPAIPDGSGNQPRTNLRESTSGG